MSDDQITTILVAIAEVKAEVKNIAKANDAGERVHVDFESRLRALEKVRWVVVGFALALGGSGGALATRLLG